ncbi:hypothetical protein AVEN_63294-1 [Araneus ventricosus]|uniref:Uncharacterized protein n=1 Tax=Araneus ventricosus TaxID=182803 RepID=A0A4Y2FL61_ARAVE|nr:hypothetical protein AVEN_63294-1 [Araneus ventricosus]
MKRREIIPPAQYSAVLKELGKKRPAADGSDILYLDGEVTELATTKLIRKLMWRTIQFTKKIGREEKKKVAKRHLYFYCSKSEDSIHSFEFRYVDAYDNLDREDFDNEECIICSEQGRTELGFQCFMCKAPFHLYWLGKKSKPMAMRFAVIDFVV